MRPVILYLVSAKHHHMMSRYLATWGQGIASGVRLVPYAALPALLDLPGGCYIFSDIERLDERQRTLLADVAERLSAAGDSVRVLNHPTRARNRLELLERLHERDMLPYRAFRPDAAGSPWRYPVFVREEKAHNGPRSKVLHDEADLRLVLLKMVMDGFSLSDLLVVEYCDTSDAQGIFRKYSSFRIGEHIVPRHVLFSRNWAVKDLDLLEPSHIEEIHAYIHDNPHEEALRRIFETADIDYGRIDYAMRDGEPVVWEINTNPIIMKTPSEYSDARRPFHAAFAERFAEAFLSIDVAAPENLRVATPWNEVDVFGL